MTTLRTALRRFRCEATITARALGLLAPESLVYQPKHAPAKEGHPR